MLIGVDRGLLGSEKVVYTTCENPFIMYLGRRDIFPTHVGLLWTTQVLESSFFFYFQLKFGLNQSLLHLRDILGKLEEWPLWKQPSLISKRYWYSP
jgi:hypothetical protein